VPEIAVALPAVPESIPRSREVLEGLRGELDKSVLDDLRLIVSELVTNSIRHAGLRTGDPITLEISVDEQAIRLELRDRGRGFEPPPATPASPFQESGWGLFLVSKLTDRWGVSTQGGVTTVWIEIRRNPSE
jgi:anti-sigma regulatory factor (Ser/Thr protein kinase)